MADDATNASTALAYELLQELQQHFNLARTTCERCAELMTADPERQIRRNLLCKERAKLAQAQDSLSAVYKNTETGNA